MWTDGDECMEKTCGEERSAPSSHHAALTACGLAVMNAWKGLVVRNGVLLLQTTLHTTVCTRHPTATYRITFRSPPDASIQRPHNHILNHTAHRHMHTIATYRITFRSPPDASIQRPCSHILNHTAHRHMHTIATYRITFRSPPDASIQ